MFSCWAVLNLCLPSSLLTPDPVLKKYHIHRSIIRVNISVLTYTCSIFYKVTVPSQNLHSSLEPLALLPLNSFRPTVQLCSSWFSGVESAFWLSVLYLSIQVAFALSNSYLILILPNTASQKAKTLIWEWQSPHGWEQAWEGTKLVKPEPLEYTRG